LEYKDTLVWKKKNPMPRNRDRRYVPDVEMMQWYVKGKGWIFNRCNERYESCVKEYSSESGGGFKRYHETQKPIELIKNIIKIHSDEGMLVVDPFLGSGTTALACEDLGRKWVGVEKEEVYCKIVTDRLGDIVNGSKNMSLMDMLDG